MSAWIVSKAHIDALVQSLIVEQLVPIADADKVGYTLWEENRISVADRYPGDADGEWPGPIGLTIADIAAYKFEGIEPPLDDAIIVHAIECYDYQSCEHDGWETSEAHRLVHTLRDLIALKHGIAPADGEEWTDVAGVIVKADPKRYEGYRLPWGLDDITEAVKR